MGDAGLLGGRQYDAAAGKSGARWLALGLRAAGVGLLLLVPSVSRSAAEPGAKASIVPELTERQFEAKAVEAKRVKRLDLRLPAVRKTRPAASAKPLFVLEMVQVAGATVFSKEAIATSYRPLLRKTVSELDLLNIVESITERYHASGYTLSRAILSPQDIDNGRLRITVLEGRIDDIVIKGNGAERFGARRLLEPLLAHRPLGLDVLERHLLLVNDTPGVRMTDVSIEEIGEATGRFRLIVHLETWRLWTGFDLDNRGSPDIGPLQGFLATALNSHALGGETLMVNLSTIPDAPRELRFGGISFDVPLGTQGARLGLAASYSDIWPDDERRAWHGRIQTESYTLSGTIVPLRARESSLWLTAFAAIRNAEETSLLGTVYQDRIRAVGLNAAYQMRDAFEGSSYVSLNVRQGLDILGASETGGALLSRANGSSEFSKAYVTLTRQQRLSENWSVVVSGAAQAASTALLASEEFYLGGPLFGRAFRGGDVSGDAGVAGFAEVRFDQSWEGVFVKGYQVYAFVDTGAVWDRGIGDDHVSLSSFGGGLRVLLQDGLRVGFEVAVPLGDYAVSSNDGEPKVFFSLSKSFKNCSDELVLFCPSY
jgi:hemolysin activation/secretion protein